MSNGAEDLTGQAVSVEEYLRTHYEPHHELIGGRLEAKPMAYMLHGRVHALVGAWFGPHMREWGILPTLSVTVRVRPGEFRVLDAAIFPRGTPMSDAIEDVPDDPPLIAIEILSDEDRFVALRDRASDLAAMGTEHVWLVDPDRRGAYIFIAGSWQPATELRLPDSPVHLDLAWLWAQVDEPF